MMYATRAYYLLTFCQTSFAGSTIIRINERNKVGNDIGQACFQIGYIYTFKLKNLNKHAWD